MRTACFIALLLLASPMLATNAMDTFSTWSAATTNTIAGNSFKVAVGTDPVTAANTRFGVQYWSTSAKTAADAAYCLVFGITGTGATGTNWQNSDIALLSGTTTGTGTATVVAAPTSFVDAACLGTTASGICSTVGVTTKETNQDWMVVSGISPWATWTAGTTTGVYAWEFARQTAAHDTTGSVDLAFVVATSTFAIGYMAAVCPTTDGNLVSGTAPATTLDVSTSLLASPALSTITAGASSGSGSGSSFSNTTFFSLIALLISFALLN
jgi:hypothetical protein